jgi:valyl-tRNA synthetase
MPELDIKAIEEKWQNYWEKEKIYAFEKKSKKKIYSIDTPPPTVSGEMHIGHACSYSQQDFIARYKRMSGFNVFYPFGTDDNGLPTERLVEKLNNVKSKDLQRTDFIELCLKTLKKITPAFVQDWKNIAISCDYDLYYSTIDKNSQKISQKSFIDLFNSGKAYKKEFPTIWCPECQTSIAQAELEDKEQQTLFSTLKFSADGKELPIATTRPELLPACVAVFVNPKDKRYKSLIGKKAAVPLFNFQVPIISDESAEIDKGTGVLMVCSYGDKYDAEAINRHKLTPKIILNKDGTLNYVGYEGLKIKAARKKILEELSSKGLIKEQKQITNIVNVHDKCGTEIEFIPTAQWFIKILDINKKLLEQGKKVSWHPEFMLKRYENWVNGLEWDWNISRDRHFGIPIPAWECPKCKQIIVAEEKELPIDPLKTKKTCSKCKIQAQPEIKVFDTWQTSSVSPQIAASLCPEQIKLPFSLRGNAHDIIRTWDFYTITKSYMHENKLPWENLVISGFITLKGEKMSKSKGNVIRPQEVMEKYGADSIRYWAASSKLGEDFDYQEKDVLTGKKFVNKILNATAFAFMNLKYQNKMPKLEETDRLFLTQLNKLIETATNAFQEYNYSRAKTETDSFFWQTLCDNYLEIIKNRVYQGTEQQKASAFYTLYQSLLTITKLFAPFTPFITEEIYQTHFKKNEKAKSIHNESWPTLIKIKENKEDDKIWQKLLEIVKNVRQAKSEAKKSMKAEIVLTLEKVDMSLLSEVLEDLKTVSTAKEIKEGKFNIQFI